MLQGLSYGSCGQEYFKARADTTEAELARLRQLSERAPDSQAGFLFRLY